MSYRPGNWKVACDRTADEVLASETVKEVGTGYIVKRGEEDRPHPRDYARGLRYRGHNRVYDPRPEPEDVFLAVKASLHFDGADTSTTITDSSAVPHTFACVGNAQLDTAQKKFGSSALLLDGTGDYVTSASHTDWNLSIFDLGIDMWVRFAALTGSQALIAADNADYSTGWELYWSDNNKLNLYFGGVESSLTWAPSANTWYHVAVARSVGAVTAYIDGASIGTFTDGDFNNDSNALIIGADGAGSSDYFNGWIDEVRIVKGVASWTANFTPPTSAYS